MDNSIKLKDLTKIGYTDNKARSLVATIFNKHFKHFSRDEKLGLLVRIKEIPEKYLRDEATAKIARVFAGKEDKIKPDCFTLSDKAAPLKIYGAMHVEEQTIKQMELALALPISVQGALMPDAHSGYGLPIGAVLATDNAVIPYGVGMDIGCRMRLSILDAGESFLKRYDFQLRQALRDFTHFGMEGGLDFRQEHEVLDIPLFRSMPLLRIRKLRKRKSLCGIRRDHALRRERFKTAIRQVRRASFSFWQSWTGSCYCKGVYHYCNE